METDELDCGGKSTGANEVSSYLTVMGMEARLSVSLSCSLAPLLIRTYLFFSFSAAAADRRGPHFLYVNNNESYF